MIEKKFVAQKMKEAQVQEFVAENMKRAGVSHIKMTKTPLGEKIIVYATKPGMVVGKKGESIKNLTRVLKKRFNLENPQIELSDVDKPNLDPQIIAERVATSLERFGSSKFKGIGHKTMSDVTAAGALGIEILISGKIPGARAKRWRFYKGYLKKCGDVAITGIRTAYASAQLKSGTIGVQIRIMPPDIKLPDDIKILGKKEEPVEESSKNDSGKDSFESKVSENLNVATQPSFSKNDDTLLDAVSSVKTTQEIKEVKIKPRKRRAKDENKE